MATSLSSKTNIALIGMPGVGKSTLGVLLAKRLLYAFMDTDVVIQSAEGQSLQAIQENIGLDAFLLMEERYVCAIDCKDHVIATGGSVIYRQQAMQHLQSIAQIVHLDLDPELLRQRLGDLNTRGVVRPPGMTLNDLYDERLPLYHQYAKITINCNHLSPEQVLDRISGAV